MMGNSVTLETEIPLFKTVELGQETIQSRNEDLQFFANHGYHKKCKQTNKHHILNLTAAVSKFSQLLREYYFLLQVV